MPPSNEELEAQLRSLSAEVYGLRRELERLRAELKLAPRPRPQAVSIEEAKISKSAGTGPRRQGKLRGSPPRER